MGALEDAGSSGCQPGVSGEMLLLYVFLSILPILLRLRASAFSKEGGPPCTAKGSSLYSYGVLHTRANIFLGFFQIEFYVFIVIITYTKREQIFFPTVLSFSFSQQHLLMLFLTLIKSNLPLFSFMVSSFSVFSEKA